MKKYLMIFMIALAMSGMTARVYSATNVLADEFHQAEVMDISGTKYFPCVLDAVAKAEKSINLVMFIIEVSQYKEDSKVNQLVNGLIEAKKRGVDVEVILDQNVDFVQRRHASDWEAKVRSIKAYKRLRDAGIRVHYDEPIRYAHAKAIVIDKSMVILGSTNWTESSFDKSIETNVLIKSQELAENILSYFKTIKIDTEIEKYLDSIGPSTAISWEFMENPELVPLMIRTQDERAFDVYLFLLRVGGEPANSASADRQGGTFTLFYDTLAKYLGIYEGWTVTDYRRQIIKVLRRLEEKYKLIKFEPRYAKEATITLLNYACNSEESCFELPDDYFDFGWNRSLSFRAKFCYFVNLAYSSISDIKPFWSKSVATIIEQFGGVCQDVINKGMGELRRKKLIEVKYDEISGKPYEERMPKMYKILKLYDSKELELKLKQIEEKYGKDAYTKAEKYAEIVFEENSPEVIEDIILKIKEYGDEKVKKAFDIVFKKNIDNPKRVYSYVVGIIAKIE